MGETCTFDCAQCELECSERQNPKTDFREDPHVLSRIRCVIGVVSGKGGVGKSLVTSLLGVIAKRAGLKVGILDADITGPSIPKIFGLREKAEGSELGLYPVASKTGIQIMSMNVLLEGDTDPVIWRGPIIAGAVKQFWTEVIWGDLDILFIDMPPGTGDVPLTVFQTIPVDGVVIVTTPQELVGMVVEKAVHMAEAMHVPIVGLAENMSYVKCPGCSLVISPFGESRLEEFAKKHNISAVAKLPIEPELASKCDLGKIESFEGDWLTGLFAAVENILKNKA